MRTGELDIFIFMFLFLLVLTTVFIKAAVEVKFYFLLPIIPLSLFLGYILNEYLLNFQGNNANYFLAFMALYPITIVFIGRRLRKNKKSNENKNF